MFSSKSCVTIPPAHANSIHALRNKKMKKFKLHKQLYFQVIISIIIGVLLGHFYPELAVKMKPLGDGFIKLIRMMVPPIIFTTVVTGIANMKNIKDAGRIGMKSLIYFEVLTTLAMFIGLGVA